MIRKLLLYEEVAELFTVLLRREIFSFDLGPDGFIERAAGRTKH